MRPSPARSPRVVTCGNYKISIAGPKSNPGFTPWITQFCSDPANSWYVPIDADWAADWFNQHGFNSLFDNFDEAIELIADQRTSNWDIYPDEQIHNIHVQATRLYGLLHGRWICQPRGMVHMKAKYEKGAFGQCPRSSCNGTKVLPMGTTLTPRRHSVKLDCPMCCDIYRCPKDNACDGAHFGPAFPHMFLFEYAQFDISKQFRPFARSAFGFKVRQQKSARPLVHAVNVREEEKIED
jgi:casein kinase II subunit beta